MRAISRECARGVDREAGERFCIPSICLMENAGAGAARVADACLTAARTGVAAPVVCVAGPGQNGGDAYVVARHLALEGRCVSVFLLGPSSGTGPRGDAATNLAIVRALDLPVHDLRSAAAHVAFEDALRGAALVVDGLFGTGLDRPLTSAAADVVLAMNACAPRILSLDVPSGLDCDTGRPLGACVRAEVTATFVAAKVGFLAPGAAEWTGRVEVVGIGAPLTWPLPEA